MSNSSATSFFRSSNGTCDFLRSRSQSFLDLAIESALGFEAFRSWTNAFCLAWLSFDEAGLHQYDKSHNIMNDVLEGVIVEFLASSDLAFLGEIFAGSSASTSSS